MEPQIDPAAPNNDQRRESLLASLLSQLFREAEVLLLQEVALFRAEMAENAGHLAWGALIVLAGLLTVLIGAIAIMAAATLSLGYVMPMWLACALVGILVIAAGVLLGLYGRRLMAHGALKPQRTLESLRETGEWLREELT